MTFDYTFTGMDDPADDNAKTGYSYNVFLANNGNDFENGTWSLSESSVSGTWSAVFK